MLLVATVLVGGSCGARNEGTRLLYPGPSDITVDKPESCTSVSAPVEDVVWIGWSRGKVSRSVDGGRSWEEKHTPFIRQDATNRSTTGIAALDDSNAWLFNGQSIFRTMDGGDSWGEFSNPGLIMRDIDPLDAGSAWGVGHRIDARTQYAVVLRSGDGTDWEETSLTDRIDRYNPAARITAIDPLTCLVSLNEYEVKDYNCRNYATVRRTRDGGASWDTVLTLPGESIMDIESHGEGLMVVLGRFKAYVSIDGGTTWEAKENGEIADCSDLELVDSLTGWAVGYGKVLKTEDGFETWTSRCAFVAHHNIGVTMIDAAGANQVWLINGDNMVIGSDDGFAWAAELWPSELQSSSSHIESEYTTPFSLASDSDSFGEVYKLGDGEAWFLKREGCLAAYGADTVYLCSHKTYSDQYGKRQAGEDTISMTTDGGKQWKVLDTGLDKSISDVGVADVKVAWAVGQDGMIIRTEDGGTTWSEQESGVKEWLSSVCVLDPDTAWVAGANGVILKTSDAGDTWSRQASGTGNWLDDVAAYDTDTAWAVGVGGTILMTRDGGSTWKRQDSGTDRWLRNAAVTPRGTCWVGGDYGALLSQEGWGGWESYELPGNDQYVRYREYSHESAVDSGYIKLVSVDDDEVLLARSGRLIHIQLQDAKPRISTP